jgi:putative transcriptional regulator
VKPSSAKAGVTKSDIKFAAIMGIGKTTVQQWEQGQKNPSGTAQRLLNIIDRKGLSVIG